MKHWIKASVASGALVAGFAAREMTTSAWRFAVYAGAVAIVFAQNLWEVRPDKRLDKARRVDLDMKLKALFAEAQKGVRPGQRLPFRVNVMVRRWGWFGPKLQMVYSFEMKTTDSDYAICWGWGRGLCWHVLRTGKAAFADCDSETCKDFRLTKRQRLATRHVKAVLSLPIRRADNKDGEPLKPRVVAVLNVDAISGAAAFQLREYWKVTSGSIATRCLI